MRVFEKECRSALVKSGIPGTEYCLNPYGGCAHACVYCYAAFMRRFLGTDLPWGSFVQVKVNFAQRLAAQLKRPKQGTVLLSTVTDPYQPVERHYCLTRASLEALA
ncbi:MAG: radical SAM protein, partial [Syntrophomonadaceae bacterium]|nr:radical SAM protein [Syntrophomonadaceae bacterium]